MNTSTRLGLKLSRLMLGTVQFGLPYGVANRAGQPTPREVLDIVSAALDGGVNCFDTAAEYGTSEEVLGQVFHELGVSEEIVIVTKVRPLTAEALGDSKLANEEIEESVAESRRRLRLERLPIVMFHRESDVIHSPALERLKSRGWIQHAGVSCDNHPEFATTAIDNVAFSALQIPGNLLDHRHQQSGVFQLAATQGTAVFIRSVFMQGLLLMPDDEIPLPLRDILPIRRELESIAVQGGMSLAELSVRYMLALDGVTCVLTGVETVDQIRDNLAIFDRGPLSADMITAISSSVPELPDALITPSLWPRRDQPSS